MSDRTPRKKPPARSARRLSPEGRRALEMLATCRPTGATEAILMAYGFTPALLAGMAANDFASEMVTTVRASTRMLVVRRLRITDAGRRALDASRRQP